jgi:hypothetical protein
LVSFNLSDYVTVAVDASAVAEIVIPILVEGDIIAVETCNGVNRLDYTGKQLVTTSTQKSYRRLCTWTLILVCLFIEVQFLFLQSHFHITVVVYVELTVLPRSIVSKAGQQETRRVLVLPMMGTSTLLLERVCCVHRVGHCWVCSAILLQHVDCRK